MKFTVVSCYVLICGTILCFSFLQEPNLTLNFIGSIKREEEIKRREKIKEQKEKQKQQWIKQQLDQGKTLEEIEMPEEVPVEEEPLPEIYIPETPSPILCGFYSDPGRFWLSLVNVIHLNY